MDDAKKESCLQRRALGYATRGDLLAMGQGVFVVHDVKDSLSDVPTEAESLGELDELLAGHLLVAVLVVMKVAREEHLDGSAPSRKVRQEGGCVSSSE